MTATTYYCHYFHLYCYVWTRNEVERCKCREIHSWQGLKFMSVVTPSWDALNLVTVACASLMLLPLAAKPGSE